MVTETNLQVEIYLTFEKDDFLDVDPTHTAQSMFVYSLLSSFGQMGNCAIRLTRLPLVSSSFLLHLSKLFRSRC